MDLNDLKAAKARHADARNAYLKAFAEWQKNPTPANEAEKDRLGADMTVAYQEYLTIKDLVADNDN